MMDAAIDLQQALYKSLSQDEEFLAALGGAKIYDHVPEKVACPYIVLGRSTVIDWSTATEGGEANVFFIHTWSRSSKRDESHILQAHIKRIIDEKPLVLNDHHLVNLRFQLSETRRDRLSGHIHGVVRFRGVTEPKFN